MFQKIQSKILGQLKNKQGLSFIEVVAVIAIVAVLAVTAFSDVKTAQDKAKASSTGEDLSAIKTSLELYNADNGNYPTSLIDLKPTYLKKANFISSSIYDKWGRALSYNSATGEICSDGPDKTAGNTDDICR